MFSTLNEREKNLVYTLLVLAGLFVIYKYVYIKETAYFQATKANYEILSNKITEYNIKTEKLSDLQQEETDLQAKLAEVSAPFNVDIMGGQQINFIGARLEDAGLKIINVAPLETKALDSYYIQNLDFNIQGTYGGLQQFFYDTENSQYAYKIVKFQISPQPIAGIDPQLLSINYNKLDAHVIISLVADKAAKVAKPINQIVKLDIFKPSDLELAKIIQTQAENVAKAAVTNTPGNTAPTPNFTPPAVVVSTSTLPPAQNVPDKQPIVSSNNTSYAPSVKNKNDVINYTFEKK